MYSCHDIFHIFGGLVGLVFAFIGIIHFDIRTSENHNTGLVDPKEPDAKGGSLLPRRSAALVVFSRQTATGSRAPRLRDGRG
ncbi:hypothetical protein BC936DRAFT_142643 [Jimgerdemannia flammicorona]|uniref:Uncharacterized protein n=1 Tax=Jimgerdemannia flammicorona TaxID=994334 RepID=A0A433DEU2_9FUNG|nr:hypothetical protein BC936DRAFT_142643 [Jimgerdemannia flammicorona]